MLSRRRACARIAVGAVLGCMAVLARANSVLGPAFPIAEPDTAEEIRQKAAAFNWHQWMSRQPAQFAAFRSAPLSRASRNVSRLFDPTYLLPQEIVDQHGRVLYPKGYAINVYQTLHLPGRYIVIGDRAGDYRWLREVAKPGAADKVLLAGGNVFEEREKTHLELFLLDQRFIERFGLRAVPSIVSQEGDQLRITEYLVKAGRS